MSRQGTGRTPAGLPAQLAGAEAIRIERHEVVAKVRAERLPGLVSHLLGEGGRLADLFGVEVDGRPEIQVTIAPEPTGRWLRLVGELWPEGTSFPSLTPVTRAAGWYEREIWSELGVRPDGHPGPPHLRLPSGWPERIWPLRRGWAGGDAVALGSDGAAPALAAPPEGVVDYPLGPIRSGVTESAHYVLRTVGEEIVDLALRLFYKHRGIEVRAVGLGPLHLPLLAERISGTDGFNESLALCRALEDLAGIDPPPRAQAVRTVFAELERLHNHLGYQADLCQATGLVVGQAQFNLLKEAVLRLNAGIAGHRYLFGLNVAGGVSRDLDDDARTAIRRELRAVRRSLERVGHLAFSTASHVDRLEGTGVLAPDEARAYATVGPVARASAQDGDLRRDHPYGAYGEVDFHVPVRSGGDALARAQVVLEESHQALAIVMQVLDRMPSGPVRVPVGALPPARWGFGWAESARGETLHRVMTDDAGLAGRYRVRTPSFANWQAFPVAVPGHNILTDFPVIEQSFGLSVAGNDR